VETPLRLPWRGMLKGKGKERKMKGEKDVSSFQGLGIGEDKSIKTNSFFFSLISDSKEEKRAAKKQKERKKGNRKQKQKGGDGRCDLVRKGGIGQKLSREFGASSVTNRGHV